MTPHPRDPAKDAQAQLRQTGPARVAAFHSNGAGPAAGGRRGAPGR